MALLFTEELSAYMNLNIYEYCLSLMAKHKQYHNFRYIYCPSIIHPNFGGCVWSLLPLGERQEYTLS